VAGGVLLAAGAPVLVLGVLVWSLGLERSLSAWNDQLALLPWGLHRILGLVTFLGIPPALPAWIAVTGAVLSITGVVGLSGWRPATARRGDDDSDARGSLAAAPDDREDVPDGSNLAVKTSVSGDGSR
jgi:hypothetical protein